MGLMDRLKETAQEVATEAKKAGVQAQSKLGEVQLRRRLDDSAKQLGYLIFRERAQGTPAGSDADTLINQMRDLEEELARQQEAAHEATKAPPSSAPEGSGDGDLMEDTPEGAAPPQSPPEGQATDQPTSG
ncbi:hypothetical protein BH24ACT26_BH24ACT26_02080 [soil metagenome]